MILNPTHIVWVSAVADWMVIQNDPHNNTLQMPEDCEKQQLVEQVHQFS